MRIAVVIKNTHFHSGYGGMETQNKVLVEGLAKRGHDITVFSPLKDLTIKECDENGVKYIFVPCIFKQFSVLFEQNKNSWPNKSFLAVLTTHQKKPYDLILSQSSSGLGIIRNKKKLGIKVISISHGTKLGEVKSRLKSINSVKELVAMFLDFPHVLRAFFGTQREFVHGSDKIIAVSNAVKKELVAETYVSDKKVVVVHNGVEFVEDEKAETFDTVVRLIYVGRIIRAKGVFSLVSSLTDLKNLNWQMDIVGSGPDLGELKQKVKQADLLDRFIFHGQLPHEGAMQMMLHSDVFVMPTIRVEGFPMVLVEAMFAGLSVVASDIGGNVDAVDNGKTGFLVKPGDKADFTQKLKKLIESSELRRTFGINAKIKAKDNFTVDIMLNKYEEVFKEVLYNENS